MITFKNLQYSAEKFNKNDSEDYITFSNTINELRKQYSTYNRRQYTKHNFRKGYRKNHNSTTNHKDSKLKSLLANSDKMISNFTSAINKLNERNFKIIYKNVVQLFTNYIGEFITDYIESYVKFGMDNKCDIEDLNLNIIKEKYNHYQKELWKILIDKYMNSRSTYMMYYKFINSLINWNTELFNKTILTDVKAIFKSYCSHNYDIIKLDGINEEDPIEFFKPSIVELSDRDTAIYNKITEIVTIFKEYDFSLDKIKECNTEFLYSINYYIDDISSLNIEPINDFKKMITKYIRNDEMGERIGLLWYYHLLNSNNLSFINNVLDSLNTSDKYNGQHLSVVAYMFMGILNNSDMMENIILYINKDELKDKIENISKKLPAQIRYKMMDIIDLL
jgi:hypothetical protein